MRAADIVFSRRVRQNHALEHATVTLLSRDDSSFSASARSNARGFVIFADLDPARVRAACDEALERLHWGEAELAIHPNCGTNLAMGMSVMMVGSLFGLTALRTRTRIASAMASSLAGVAIARPLGEVMQRHVTTTADLRDVQITEVLRRRFLGRPVIEVLTATTR